MAVKIKLAYENIEEIKDLFLEYTQMLIENDSNFTKYLEVQNYKEELNHITEKYGFPDGRLYIAYIDDKPAGCIGLRKIDKYNCEMKRLYVRKEYRGQNIANKLVELLINEAKNIGYKAMLLDTLPFLKPAIYLYKKYDFYEIESYNNSPMSNSIYMKLEL